MVAKMRMRVPGREKETLRCKGRTRKKGFRVMKLVVYLTDLIVIYYIGSPCNRSNM